MSSALRLTHPRSIASAGRVSLVALSLVALAACGDSGTGTGGAGGTASTTSATSTGTKGGTTAASTSTGFTGNCAPSGSNSGAAVDCSALCGGILTPGCTNGPPDGGTCVNVCEMKFKAACPQFDNFVDCGGDMATWSCVATKPGVKPSTCLAEWQCMVDNCM